MRSCLYECEVTHTRTYPVRHRFAYRTFLFAIDLDELNTLEKKLKLFGAKHHKLYRLDVGDYLPGEDRPPTLKERIQQRLYPSSGITVSKVLLLTLPRFLGYAFNPVSFYYCQNDYGQPLGAIAEVTNTFREVKSYTLDCTTLVPRGRRLLPEYDLRTPKYFYVSPFTAPDAEFHFRLREPAEKLSIQIDSWEGGRRRLVSTLEGRRQSLDDGRLLAWSLLYPLLGLQVISKIHWQAFLLWMKRTPWHAKSAGASLQRDLHSQRSPLPKSALHP